MFEVIGHITVYLVVGGILWPIGKSIKQQYKNTNGHIEKSLFVCAWPFALLAIFAFLYFNGLLRDNE